mmetsp:Transcript_3650/g.5784  ORF Transcript_3650/g.5784 Transcript_3650/m.5784 type:complete len:106 (+) Transcript_3650:1-318(+)
MEMKRERNRLHAKKSRLRKKSLTSTLEETLESLKAENAKLRESIYKAMGRAQTEQLLQKRILDSHDRFIQSVGQNRVVDSKTGSFLRGLRRKAVAASKKRTRNDK